MFSQSDGRRTTEVAWLLGYLMLLLLVAPASSLADSVWIEGGAKSTWQYLDDGSEPPRDWFRREFRDPGWKVGRAPFGYGEEGLSTELEFGSDPARKPITTYFRRRFEVTDPSHHRQLLILLQVDDGAIVYLNGQELVRENLAAGPTGSRTTAQQRRDGSDEGIYHRYLRPASPLRMGENWLAVEVHQFDPASSDVFFDLVLKSYGEGEEPQPARLAPRAREVTLAYLQKHYVPSGERVPDGFTDGGRRMEIGAAGTLRTDREVILVDRYRDAELQKHLAYARSEFISKLPPLARARFLALYVDMQCSPTDGRNIALSELERLESEYRGREMLLGKSIGTGVCRHRALLFKILADDAGLAVGLVRGNLSDGGEPEPHAWNELILDDGQKRIVDCMNPRGGFDFPLITEAIAQRFFTVGNAPFYSAERLNRKPQ